MTLFHFLLLCNIVFTFSFNIPLYRQWNCIGIENKIDNNKPFDFKVGDIPLIAWKTKNNSYISTLNFCKHFGSELSQGHIDNDCLVCPYHGIKHSRDDMCGEIITYDNKLWWAYNPIYKSPPKILHNNIEYSFHNKNYSSDYIEIIMNEELPSCMYNSMDINHAQFIHKGIFGFGSDIPIKNYKHHKYDNKNIIGTSFDHFFKENVKIINKKISLQKNYSFTTNYHEFIYPSTTWSVVKHSDNKELIVQVDMLPIEEFKTKWFVTVRSNYMKDHFSKKLLKFVTHQILNQDKLQFNKQSKNIKLRNKFLLQKKLNYEEHISDMENLFSNYNYPKLDIFLENF